MYHCYTSSEDVKWYKHVGSLKSQKWSEVSFLDCQRQGVGRWAGKCAVSSAELAGVLCLPLGNSLVLGCMSHLKPRHMSVGDEAFELTCPLPWYILLDATRV